MTRRVLVPLYRIEVPFTVRHGRRWSALEHLVLWACKEPTSAPDLARMSSMPLRLVSECLVNLLRVGWIALRASDDGSLFAATELGTTAAAQPVPEQFLEKQPRSTQLYLDRVSGEFFEVSELATTRKEATDFRPEEALAPNHFNAAPYGPELIDRLRLGVDEIFEDFLRRPHVLPGELFAVLEVTAGNISGLPARTPAIVGLRIMEALREREPAGGPVPEALPSIDAALGQSLQQRAPSSPIRFGPDTLVVGGPAHLAAAERIIKGARRMVVIHSTFVGRNIEALLPALRDAVAAGVQVYVHWGKKDDPERRVANPSELAANMARAKIDKEFRENLHLGARSTGSHAKVILADTGDANGYSVLLGSCNWLDSPFASVEASVLLTDPGAIALVAGQLASLIVPAVGYEIVVTRLIEVRAECSDRPKPNSAHRAMLIVDEDHYAAVRDAMREVKRGGTVLLGSHKFGHAGETTVLDPMIEAARYGAQVKLYYTRVLPNLGEEAVAAKEIQLAAKAVDLKRAGEEMHAKFIGWDDKLLITSFNFLSASVNGKQRSSEIGVLLQGPGIVEAFQKALVVHNVFAEYKPREREKSRRRRRGSGRSKRAVQPGATG